MRTHDIRRKYLDFFREKDHLVLPSASLVPKDDPSLLLIGAGMAPFKKYFTGEVKPPQPRIATCQKSMRTPDIERVGRTARHCTFFEMLGNFSFGDYFKEEAIEWAWEFVTEKLQLPVEKLWVTIYQDDDEAFKIWHEKIGIPAEKIVRLGKEDNFWEIGTGPCGPCSEIYIDRGIHVGCGKDECAPGCDCDRFLEFWNLVFTQFDLDEFGEYHLLEKKNIDTGMGLERIAAIMQDVPNVFEIDIIRPILDKVVELLGIEYGHSEVTDTAIRVITEHARGVTFMICDGVLPSNEGRGYVLRRLLRRAVRFGKLMGMEQNFLYDVAAEVINVMQEAYPELKEKEEFILRVIRTEEERFQMTLNQGLEILHRLMTNGKERMIPGQEVFRLYDTYGFPVELTQEIAAENGFTIDLEGFRKHMEEQKERARSARQSDRGGFTYSKETMQKLQGIPESIFMGYERTEHSAPIQILLRDQVAISEAHEGETVAIIAKETPFYPEGGGQVGDTGLIQQETGEGKVINTRKLLDGFIIHETEVLSGILVPGNEARLIVDHTRRQMIARNHSATHLLHKALRTVLGEHAKQSGSLVSDEFLRFDVSHFEPITQEQQQQIERQINLEILANHPIIIKEIAYEDAKEQGILALFEGKYGENVRVVQTADVCEELCGGTHVAATGQIGVFKITSESSVGAGLRRIEAVTGTKALDYYEKNEHLLSEIAKVLRTKKETTLQRIEDLLEENRKLERDLLKLKDNMSRDEVDSLVAGLDPADKHQVVISNMSERSMDDLRGVVDQIREKAFNAVIILGSTENHRANLVVSVPAAQVAAGLHAGKIIKEIAVIVGGGGGGKPEMAQAGGKRPEKIDEALAKGKSMVEAMMKE